MSKSIFAHRILVAPAHYFLSDEVGSDSSVVYRTIEHLSSSLYFYIICGKAYISKPIPNSIILEASHERRLQFMLRYYYIAKHILNAHQIDVVHHMIPFGYKMTFNPLAVRGLLRNIPFVIGAINYPTTFRRLSLSNKILYSTNKILAPLTSKLQAKTLEEAEVLVFDSKKTYMIYETTYPDIVKGKMIEVIPDGIETDLFTYSPPPKREHYVLLSIGHLIELKGLQYLLYAMLFILKSVKNVELVIVGDGPYKRHLERLAKRLDIMANVKFMGHIRRELLKEFYANCDIYIQPSLQETFPSTIREAMASGRPIVATNVGFINEHIRDGINGFLVEPRDVNGLAEAIIKILCDEKLRYKMCLNNRNYAVNNFNYKLIAKKWLKVYHNAINIIKP